jgi:predicted transcriptional regulator YdeE
MKPKPNIIRKRFSIVGAESAVDFSADFTPTLQALYRRVADRLGELRGLAQPVQMVGFWQPGGRYFAGVEADTAFVPDGLAAKELPEALFAVFTEQKRGEAGGPEGYAYKWLVESAEYDYNEQIPGDFEVYRNLTDTAPDCEADIYIPIKEKEGRYSGWSPWCPAARQGISERGPGAGAHGRRAPSPP